MFLTRIEHYTIVEIFSNAFEKPKNYYCYFVIQGYYAVIVA